MTLVRSLRSLTGRSPPWCRRPRPTRTSPRPPGGRPPPSPGRAIAGWPSCTARTNSPSGFAWPSRIGATAASSAAPSSVPVAPSWSVHAHRPEPVVAVDHHVAALAEQLDAPQARPGQVVVPHAVQRAERAAAEADRGRSDVLDPVVAVEVGGVRADPLDRPAEQVEHVDVVDAVLEQRAAADEAAVGAPRGAVVALHRDELVVAHHHRHQPTGGRIVDEVLGLEERRRAAQHEADLVDDPGVEGEVGHLLGGGQRGGQRLLAEHVRGRRPPPWPAGAGARSSRCRCTPRRSRRSPRPRWRTPCARWPRRTRRRARRRGRRRRRERPRRRCGAGSWSGRWRSARPRGTRSAPLPAPPRRPYPPRRPSPLRSFVSRG